MKSKRIWFVLSFVLLLTLLVSACQPAATPTQAPQPTQPPAEPQPTQPPAEPQPTQPPAQPEEFIIGMLLVGPYNDRGWSQAHYDAGLYVEKKVPGAKLI